MRANTLASYDYDVQEVEYVKQEAKLVYLLECLQKTAPPVLVFAEKTKDVDDIHEYLLVKGVEAVAVHGGKDQEDRNLAIDGFKGGRKDVLVATDVASKGLDFPDIQHVINFDMPEEIENYVHRWDFSNVTCKQCLVQRLLGVTCQAAADLHLISSCVNFP